MRIDAYEFGRITIDGVVYDHDVVIEAGRIRKRKKGPSKKRREGSGRPPDGPPPSRRSAHQTDARAGAPLQRVAAPSHEPDPSRDLLIHRGALLDQLPSLGDDRDPAQSTRSEPCVPSAIRRERS